MELAELQKLARLIRYYILLQTYSAQSGHTTSALSAVELATALFFKYFRADLENNSPLPPLNLRGGGGALNDRFILSKGHASPLFYALYTAAGKITEKELAAYRTFDSVLEGHLSVRFPYTEGLTGSLGQGLSMGVGEALALRARISNTNSPQPSLTKGGSNENISPLIKRGLRGVNVPFVYVLLGDGEMAEGQNWEAIQYAAFKKLNNLIAIVDVNRLSQSQATMVGHDVQVYARRVASFGWRTYVVEDGHDLEIIDKAFEMAIAQSKPYPDPLLAKEREPGPAMIIAKTIKGKGVPFWEDKNGWHSKPVPKDKFEEAVKGLGEIDKSMRGVIQKPVLSLYYTNSPQPSLTKGGSILPLQKRELEGVASYTNHQPNEKVATKKAFGNALERLGSIYPDLVVLDGDVKNSLHTDQFEKAYPARFFQCYIAEQNMVSVAWGMSNLGLKPFITSFGCFLTRAHDQFRLAALSEATLYINGSYAGVSLGKDGPSQMGLEDMGMVRAWPNSILLYPSDAISTEKLVEAMFTQKGIVYIKTTREPTPIIYKPDEAFPIAGSKVFYNAPQPPLKLRGGEGELLDGDVITVVAAGITVFEAIKAAEQLKQDGIAVRVIDCYSIKPIDVETLRKAASETQAIITVEDHYAVGGLGDAVLEALADTHHVSVHKLAVNKIPRSGTPEELLAYEEIDAKAIVKKVKEILALH